MRRARWSAWTAVYGFTSIANALVGRELVLELALAAAAGDEDGQVLAAWRRISAASWSPGRSGQAHVDDDRR